MKTNIDSITKEHFENLYKDNSQRDIAKMCGCSLSTVQRKARKLGVKPLNRTTMRGRQNYAEANKNSGRWIGEKNPNWKGGISKSKYDRAVVGITFWRKSVKRRDNYTCQICGIDGKIACKCCGRKPVMHADHIKSWSENPDIRLDINNGRTLCEDCHRKTLNLKKTG